MLTGIVQIAFSSADPAKLAAWYRDTLGLRVAFEASGMTFFLTGGVRFMIGPAQPDQAVGGDAILYFEPENWDKTIAALEAKRVPFVGDATPVQEAKGRQLMVRAFRDPEGHRVALLGWRAI